MLITFTPRVTPATQFTTAYLGDQPIASLRRRHAFDPHDAPAWVAHDLHGEELFTLADGETITFDGRARLREHLRTAALPREADAKAAER